MSENPFASPPDDNNPYSSPSAEGSPTGNPLVVPAAILLTLSSIMLLLLLISLPGMVLMALDFAEMAEQEENMSRAAGRVVGMLGFLLALFVTHIVMIFGSISMIRLKGYPLARVAGVLAVIPLCSACYVVGIPFGIWVLVLLRRDDVKRKFR